MRSTLDFQRKVATAPLQEGRGPQTVILVNAQ